MIPTATRTLTTTATAPLVVLAAIAAAAFTMLVSRKPPMATEPADGADEVSVIMAGARRTGRD
ncbi:hypothetical protein ACFV3N_05575 [Streptomyces bauhiniae]|uniref:hypothetical protein n=1 Tax=Streptomyces bauhiniae TaxID=2340725 RepID=UPI003647D1E6